MFGSNPDLFAIRVADDEASDYRVREGGWYAADDGEKIVLGPFDTLAECETAIGERAQMSAQSAA